MTKKNKPYTILFIDTKDNEVSKSFETKKECFDYMWMDRGDSDVYSLYYNGELIETEDN